MLKKLSLAALVAMGSMSVASATDLSSAIKGVDLKGALRIRLYNENPEKGDNYNKWRTNAAFIFAVPVSENLKLVDRVSTETYVTGGASTVTGKSANGVNSSLADNVLFAKYSKNGLTVLAGKIPVATPVTDNDLFGPPSHGAGALATYKVNDNLTVAGAFVDALVAIDGGALKFNTKSTGANTYAAAAIFNNDMVAAQLWYFNVDKAIDSDVVLRADIKNLPVALHVDYATAKLDSNNVVNTLGVTNAAGNNIKKTQTYFNVNATFKQDAICAELGYAKTGKDGGIVVLDADSPISAVAATHQAYTIANTADNDMVYAKLGYNVDPKTNVYAAYTVQDTSSVSEIEVGGSFQYTKKFTLSAYYSMLSADSTYTNVTGTKGDNNEARVEALYKF